MRILITGGTGLVGNAVVQALSERGHTLRILSRHAHEFENGSNIEAWPASVTDVAGLAGAAADCDVVLHVAGIVAESKPDLTFERVNVEGTRNMVREADINAVRRIIYVSSFGAATGTSDYHKSKLDGEISARSFPRDKVIVRLGNVYGPGDDVISALVKLVRALPAVPVIDSGDQEFQPIWHEDAGAALADIVEANDIDTDVLNLVGPDVVTPNRLLDILGEITGQQPRRIPLPSGIAGLAARFAATAGIDIPLKPDVLQMLLDSNALRPGEANALGRYVQQPTRITAGLRKLLECMPEQDLDEGYGAAQHRRFAVRIENPTYDADELFRMFCEDYSPFLPVQRSAQQNNPRRLAEGETITLTLPVRGDMAVRVEEAADNAVTLVTVEGHPLAGFVRFTFKPTHNGLLFEINVYDRPATLIDTLGMALGGSYAQRTAWLAAAENVVEKSGGQAPDRVQHEAHRLSEQDVTRIVNWIDQLRASKSRS